MCGRYNIEFDQDDEIDAVIRQVDQKIKRQAAGESYALKLGEIRPTDKAPILVGNGCRIEAEVSNWGFPNSKNKGMVINARAESAMEKPMFRNSLIARRCIIPSTGFYEWDQQKRRYFIRKPDSQALYMAGFYNYYDELNRFVILTTSANASMEVIHDRMPVILRRDELKDWLFDGALTNEILHSNMPELKLTPMTQEFEQLSLF